MELVVIIVMFLVIFSVLLKMTFIPQYLCVPVCIALAFFVGESWEYAASQSKTQIADWLQNPELMLNMAVLLTIDVLMQISFCALEAKRLSGESLSKTENAARYITMCIPGILIFPTLLAILVVSIFAFPGVDFITIAWSLAAIIIIVGSLGPLMLKWLLPDWDLRLELMFMINVLIAILGVVATVNGRTAMFGTNSIEWQPLVGIILILLCGSSCGFLIFLRKSQKNIN